MFTDCPACVRQFRVRAEHLSAAAGQVKCGYCGEQFNAMERLRDRPLPAQDLSVPVLDQEDYVEQEPEFHIPGIENDVEDSEIEQAQEVVAEHELKAEYENVSDYDYDFPKELLEEPQKRSGWLGRFIWGFLTLGLLLIAAAQLSWFNRDRILSHYPELLPQVRQLCERFHCELIRHRDVAAIKILNRDVRDHPRFEQALLVNATIVNSASLIQAYPRIQLGLFDTNGKLLAYREFSSDDYLDGSIDVENGMFPDTPIHVVLEVIGATEGAVSFEFRFL